MRFICNLLTVFICSGRWPVEENRHVEPPRLFILFVFNTLLMYAFGVTLWEIFSSHVPYDTEQKSADEIIEELKDLLTDRDDPLRPDLRLVDPRVWPLLQVCALALNPRRFAFADSSPLQPQRCWAMDPKDRVSAADLSIELQKLLRKAPPAPAPAHAPPPARAPPPAPAPAKVIAAVCPCAFSSPFSPTLPPYRSPACRSRSPLAGLSTPTLPPANPSTRMQQRARASGSAPRLQRLRPRPLPLPLLPPPASDVMLRPANTW